MIAKLKDLKEGLVEKRDDASERVKNAYERHISGLYLQQEKILDAIILQFNRRIHYYEELIAMQSEIERHKLNIRTMEQNFKNRVYRLNIANILNESTHSSQHNDSSINHEPISTTVETNVMEEEDEHDLLSRSTTNINIIIDDGFVSHMSMDEAHQLAVNDMIDHRDIEGCSVGAKIIGQTGTTLHVHYPGWDDKWNVWSDYSTELYKFAKHKSISERPCHRLFALKINDFVDVNPLQHEGWKIGKVEAMDSKSGQIKIMYAADDNQSEEFLTWVHIDNRKEIEALHAFTSAEQMQINDDETTPRHSIDPNADESTEASVSGHKRMNETESEHATRRKKRKLNDDKQEEQEYYVSAKCHICQHHFEDMWDYTVHLKEHYDSDRSKTWRTCDFCASKNKEKTFKGSTTFVYHITSHTKHYPFVCSQCGSRKSTKANLKQHYKKKHTKKGNDCAIPSLEENE